MIEFTVMGKIPAKANKYLISRSRMYKDSSVTAYEESFMFQVAKVPKNHFNDKDRLKVNYEFYIDHDCDADNMEKTVNDCMQKNAIIINDNRIDYHTTRKIKDKNPRCIIQIEKLEG